MGSAVTYSRASSSAPPLPASIAAAWHAARGRLRRQHCAASSLRKRGGRALIPAPFATRRELAGAARENQRRRGDGERRGKKVECLPLLRTNGTARVGRASRASWKTCLSRVTSWMRRLHLKARERGDIIWLILQLCLAVPPTSASPDAS